MPIKVTKKRIDEFLAKLEGMGGTAGNGRLRQALGWDEDFYWRTQGRLVEESKIVPGRGKGGSVRLTPLQMEEATVDTQFQPETIAVKETVIESTLTQISIIRERDLYRPLADAIKTKWINRFGYDDVNVDETHSRGSKDTGGTFTRPDITVAGIRRYIYLPKRLEIVTFEVKTADSVGIMGVLEAIAHREAAHRSYVVYACDRLSFDAASESERILDLAQKYGVGIITVEDPRMVEGWEVIIDAIRHEPDPARLDRFLSDLPSEAMKRQLSKWKE